MSDEPKHEDNYKKTLREFVLENFLESCHLLVKSEEEDLDDHDFQYCLNTIHAALQYIKCKRENRHVL